MSTRQYNRSYQAGDSMKSLNCSPDSYTNQNSCSPPSNIPQAPLRGSMPYAVPIPIQQPVSGITEPMQHQIDLGKSQVSQMSQMPLDPVENYARGNRLPNGLLNEKLGCSKKENLHIEASNITRVEVTPKKGHVGIYSSDNNSVGPRAKEGDFKQQTQVSHHLNAAYQLTNLTSSAPHTPDSSPGKAQSIDLIEALRASAREKCLTFPRHANGTHIEDGASSNESSTEEPQTQMKQPINPKFKVNSELRPLVAESMSTFTAPTQSSFPESCVDNIQAEVVKPKKAQKNRKRAIVRNEITGSHKNTVATPSCSINTPSPTLTDTTDYKSATTSFSEASSRNHSFASAKSVVSLVATNDSSMEELKPTLTPVTKHVEDSGNSSNLPTPKPSTSRSHYASKSLKGRRATSDPQSNTDLASPITSNNSEMRCISENLNSASKDVSCNDFTNHSGSPISSLRDPEEWPALESAKATLPMTADIKPHVVVSLPSITVSHATGTTKNSNAVIPALPLNMIPQRRNS